MLESRWVEQSSWHASNPAFWSASAVHLQNGASLPRETLPRWSPFWQVQPLVRRLTCPSEKTHYLSRFQILHLERSAA
jgi:hypothetical protein